MAIFHRNTRRTKLDIFAFSYITILCMISVHVFLVSARPNQQAGVMKATDELPSGSNENQKADDTEQDSGEIDEDDVNEDEEGEDLKFPKKYTEYKTTTSSNRIKNSLQSKKEDNQNNENDDDESLIESSKNEESSTFIRTNKTVISSTPSVNHGLMPKNYYFILFIPVLTYFLM